MYEWNFCHIRKGLHGFEVSFFSGTDPTSPNYHRAYDAKPDAIFDTLTEAEAYAATNAKHINVIECPPFGF